MNPNLAMYICHISPDLGTNTCDGVRGVFAKTYLAGDKLTKLTLLEYTAHVDIRNTLVY